MAKNRKAPKAAPAGVAWPADGSGGHSTTPTAQKILGASLDAVKLESPVGQSSKAWRFGYVKHFTNAVTGMAGRSSDTVAMAQAGLAAAHSAFEFTRDGKTTALADAMDGKTFPGTFQTGVIKGSGLPAPGWSIPYEGKNGIGGRNWYGPGIDGFSETIALVHRWATAGTIDESVEDALDTLTTNPAMLDLTGKVFVLIGATSEMGPLDFLLKHNATVVGIARPSGKWKGLLKKAATLPGEFHYPMEGGTEGADAMSQTPELANWLTGLFPDKQLVICCYIYQDGEAFVRASVAMDAIIKAVSARRAVKPAIAFIDTPTHVHCVPDTADAGDFKIGCVSRVSAALYAGAPLWQKALRWQLKPVQYNSVPRTTGATSHRPQFSGNLLLRLPLQFDPCVVQDFNLGHTSCRCHPVSHVCAPDHAHLCRRERTYSRQWLGATGFKVFSAVSNAQGPNYALAKMIQRWRAICAHEVDGQLVSINVAPGARTYSVMHASQVAAVLNKIHYFAPNEFYEPATVSTIMALLLVHDVQSPKLKTSHPLELVSNNAWHGGAWSSAYTIDSIGPIAYIIHLLRLHAFWLLPLAAVAGVYAYAAIAGVEVRLSSRMFNFGGELQPQGTA